MGCRQTDGRRDSPCILQDFVPLWLPPGPLSCLLNCYHEEIPKQGKGTNDHLLPLCDWLRITRYHFASRHVSWKGKGITGCERPPVSMPILGFLLLFPSLSQFPFIEFFPIPPLFLPASYDKSGTRYLPPLTRIFLTFPFLEMRKSVFLHYSTESPSSLHPSICSYVLVSPAIAGSVWLFFFNVKDISASS